MAIETAPQTADVIANGAHKAQSDNQMTAAAPKRRKPASKKVDDEGLMGTLCTLICDHQIGMFAP